MQPMLRRGVRGGERLFEERDADAFRASHFLERGRGPRLPLYHVGEQRQSHRDDLAFLGEPSDRLSEEGVLLFGALTETLRYAAVGPAKCGQHFVSMKGVEEI